MLGCPVSFPRHPLLRCGSGSSGAREMRVGGSGGGGRRRGEGRERRRRGRSGESRWGHQPLPRRWTAESKVQRARRRRSPGVQRENLAGSSISCVGCGSGGSGGGGSRRRSKSCGRRVCRRRRRRSGKAAPATVAASPAHLLHRVLSLDIGLRRVFGLFLALVRAGGSGAHARRGGDKLLQLLLLRSGGGGGDDDDRGRRDCAARGQRGHRRRRRRRLLSLRGSIEARRRRRRHSGGFLRMEGLHLEKGSPGSRGLRELHSADRRRRRGRPLGRQHSCVGSGLSS